MLPSPASSKQAISLTSSSTETTSEIKFTSAALPVSGSRLLPLISTGQAASSSTSNGFDTPSGLPVATTIYPIVSDTTPLLPRSSLGTFVLVSSESSGSSATSVIETSATLSGSSQEARQTQSSASTLTDATKSDLKSEESTSINAPLPGLKTSAALPIGGTLQARPASSTSTITTGTSTGCGDNGQCLGSVSVATPAVVDVPSSTASGDGGGWTSTIGFWTSSWHKCFKDATGTELRSCPATTANMSLTATPNTTATSMTSLAACAGGIISGSCIDSTALPIETSLINAISTSRSSNASASNTSSTALDRETSATDALRTSLPPSCTSGATTGSCAVTTTPLSICTGGLMTGPCLVSSLPTSSTSTPIQTITEAATAASSTLPICTGGPLSEPCRVLPLPTKSSSSSSSLPLCTGGPMTEPCRVPPLSSSRISSSSMTTTSASLPYCTGGIMEGPCLVTGASGVSTSTRLPAWTNSTTAVIPATDPELRSSPTDQSLPICTGGMMTGPCLISDSLGFSTSTPRQSTTSPAVGSTTPSPTSTIMTSSSLGLCTQGVMSGLCIINGTAGLSTLGPPLTSVNTSQAAIATSNSSSASTLPLPWCTGGVMEGPCIVSGTAGTSTLSTSLSPKNATSSVAPTKVSSLPSPLPFCTGGLMSSSCLVSGTAGFSTSLVSPVEGTSSGAGPVTTNTTATSNKPPARSSASEAQPLCTGGEMSGPCVVSESVTISPQPSTATSSALNSTEFTTAGPTTSAESLPASSSRLASENSLPVCTGGEMSGPCIVSGTAGPAISTPSVLPATTAVISSTQPGNTATELSDISTSLTLPWCTGGLMIGPCISSGSLGISTLTPTTSPIWTNATTTAEATSSTFPICSGGDMGGSCVVTGTAGSVLTFSPGPSTSTVGDPISVPETSTPIPAASPTSNNTSLAALPGPSSIALPVCVEGVMSGPCIVVGTAGLSISTPGVTAAVPTAAQCSQGHLSPSSPPTNHTGPSSGYPPKTTSSLYGPTATIQSTAATSNSTSSSFEIGTSLADALRGSLAQTSAWAADQTDSIGSSPRTTTTTEIATVFADPPESPSSSSSSADMPGWSGSTTNWGKFSLFLGTRREVDCMKSEPEADINYQMVQPHF